MQISRALSLATEREREGFNKTVACIREVCILYRGLLEEQRLLCFFFALRTTIKSRKSDYINSVVLLYDKKINKNILIIILVEFYSRKDIYITLFCLSLIHCKLKKDEYIVYFAKLLHPSYARIYVYVYTRYIIVIFSHLAQRVIQSKTHIHTASDATYTFAGKSFFRQMQLRIMHSCFTIPLKERERGRARMYENYR